MNSIEYTIKALKQLRKIHPDHSKLIRNKIDELAAMPDCINVKALKNHQYQYRLRVGNYRVFFNFDGVIEIVTIEEVKKRDERTY
ncbi:type II toxin-antitoxin system RelE family toxin [Acinetobacter sp. WZC-1]|uniref:type II toxin-antitoxin system RelE family toxin n=1 Tax=Acinetobacter sp. WZC-1 TaxID=3459034 RepID=UPI00403E22FE